MPSGSGPSAPGTPSAGGPQPAAFVVLVTVPSNDEGRDLAHFLIDARLAACVSIVPGLTSIYRWEGKVDENAEALLIIKTTPDRYHALEEAIRRQHRYDVPEILAVPVIAGLDAYLKWLVSSVE